MTDEEYAAFETAKREGDAAVSRILIAMPRGDFALTNELAVALGVAIHEHTGAVVTPAAAGFLVGAAGQIALALLSLASDQPTNRNH